MDATQYGLNPQVEGDGYDSLISWDDQPDSKKKEAQRILDRWGRMDSEAVNFKLHWQRCYQYIVPRKQDVIAYRMPGDDRESDVYDTTAILANEQLSAALHSMLTNPEMRFFELNFGIPELDNRPEVKDWCQRSGDVMFNVLNYSNFQTEVFEYYVDLIAAGTGHLYSEEDDECVIRFSARALKEIRIDEDAFGRVDTSYRLFKLTPRQLIQQFGKACPRQIVDLANKGISDGIEVLQAIEPIKDISDDQAALKAKFKKHKDHSTYLLRDKGFILTQSSYPEFPYCSGRWSKTTGEKYGRGPGMQMLPDIQMINAMMLTVIQGAQKTVDPPLMVEDDAVIGQVRLTPGGLTVVRPGAEKITPLITDARIDFGQKMLEDVRGRIRAGFHLDALKLPTDTPQRTAEEVRQLVEEQMRLMGPVLGRQNFEFLRPLINRLFGICSRRGIIPQAPQILKGRVFDVKYCSMIARAQHLQDAQNMARAMGVLQPLAQVKPEMIDLIDTDKAGRYVWGLFGNPANLLLSDRELAAKRKQQQQAAAQMAQQHQEQHQAEIAKKSAPMVAAVAGAQPPNNAPPGLPTGVSGG